MQDLWRAGAVLIAGAVSFGMLDAKPAQAYWYGGYYGGYAPRPYYWAPPAYYVPYDRPRILFVPPPLYIEPPRASVYVAPRVSHPIRRTRAASPLRDVCRLPDTDGPSPFTGAGEGVTPASAAGADPLLGPLPGAPAPSTTRGISPFSR